MNTSAGDFTVLELQARWDRLRVANIYDTLDQLGYGSQCLDLGIRPLLPTQHLAGIAVTVAGGRDPSTTKELEANKHTESYVSLEKLLFPGAVVVVDGGGERWTGKFGEMTSWHLKQCGAKGIVIDGMIRDYLGLVVIPDYTVCCRGTSPIESYPRWRIHRTNEVIALPGTLTSQVRVSPGDWIVAEADGVVVIPQEIAMETLIKAEEVEAKEEATRRDLAAGVSFEEVFKLHGRA
jgi:4-hydroxy-4-methyl-2-oxoglutarate aldolase